VARKPKSRALVAVVDSPEIRQRVRISAPSTFRLRSTALLSRERRIGCLLDFG
jgi:hypothetical protein